MQRRNFITALSLTALTPAAMKLQSLKNIIDQLPQSQRMPVIFAGHGSPMNAIEKNEYSNTWAGIGVQLPKPTAILCVSAHWQTNGTRVTAMEMPPTIHDFGGFPQELFDVQYGAPGSPQFAQQTIDVVKQTQVVADYDWGLDHGCWSVLKPMFPDANIPVFQLSMDFYMTPQQHYDLGKELAALRNKGVLIIGSGNIVHNLGRIQWSDTAYDWAIEFDSTIKHLIDIGDHQSIINYQKLGTAAQLSIPSNEHYLPLLYTLALKDEADGIAYFNEKVSMGSMSMRGVILG